MLKRLCCILLLVFLPVFTYAEEPLQFSKTIKNVRRVIGENRYVNVSSAFMTERFSEIVDSYNAAIDALGEDRPPVYLYLVESSRSHDIARTFDVNSQGYNYLREHLHADAMDHLKFSTYEQFCDYFYTTDHHWNYKGSYQGYLDVVRMLLGTEEKTLVPSEVIVTKVIFNGSYSRHYGKGISDEHFSFYRFDPFPEFTCYASTKDLAKNKTMAYNKVDSYLKGTYSNKNGLNHYGLFYGGDYGFLIFKGKGPEERVLLMIGNSLSNPVKTLLTAHYGTIVYVDLRHYEESCHKKFSLGETVREHGVTQILLLGDISLFNLGDDPLP